LNVVSEEDDQSPVEMSEINQAKLTDPGINQFFSIKKLKSHFTFIL